MKILGVDDDEIALDILEAAVSSEGYEFVRASDGYEALKLIQEERIQLIISDWMMPGLSGIDLAKKIREMGASSYCYIIILTSRSEKADLLNGLQAGADDFIIKPFDPMELRLRLRVAQRILALETHQLTIFALAQLADTRDNETGNHLNRIRLYSRILAEHLVRYLSGTAEEVPADFVELIYMTSPLHDIGKVGIPDCVLLKPGRLDDREFDIMKTHTTLGGQTLERAVKEYPDVLYLRIARDIAMSHHERYDGHGYPEGLQGNNIPLCARVVSLADVYDALVSRRVYKDPFTHDVAKKIIEEGRGTQFDPLVVDAFLESEKEFLDIVSRYSDDSDTDAILPNTRGAMPAC
ncbi:MAG: response regulator [Syntrophobacterales bacterium]|jgi:putative two-component system response regulator|nr:response regulator [Syntrophobacterales bacterium]